MLQAIPVFGHRRAGAGRVSLVAFIVASQPTYGESRDDATVPDPPTGAEGFRDGVRRGRCLRSRWAGLRCTTYRQASNRQPTAR
jgi:hypothetical protein